jgi:hypothetical protein
MDKPEAHRLADTPFALRDGRWNCDADDELRRLHALNGELLEALKLISATKNLARELEAEWCPAATGMVRMARAAIAKATGEQP